MVGGRYRYRCAGFSLVEVMVAAAILVITLLVIATTIANLTKENHAMSEKMASLDLERTVTAALSEYNLRRNFCGRQRRGWNNHLSFFHR